MLRGAGDEFEIVDLRLRGLGHEGAGLVIETGPNLTTVAPGDHVVLACVAPCRACFFC